MSSALACAGRRTGSCTTSLSLSTQSLRRSLVNLQDQPTALTSPSMLPNVVHLKLRLPSLKDDDGLRQFVRKILQRLPNLIAAKLDLAGHSCVFTLMPLLCLRHLDLTLWNYEGLDHVPLGALLPALQTARISSEIWATHIQELDVSGCRHLTRLVLMSVVASRVSKPPQCRLRVDTLERGPEGQVEQQLQPHLSEAHEVFLSCNGDCPPQDLIEQVCLPNLEVIRCDVWSNSLWHTINDELYDEDDEEEEFGGIAPATFGSYFRYSKNLPALKSILCGDRYENPNPVMKARIPAELADVQELIIATERPLKLSFDSAHSVGERLNTLFVVASEVSFDATELRDVSCALFRRGFTLSMVQAGQDHAHYPSQCLYIHATSAPNLSYDEAMSYVNARLQRWVRNFDGCGQCGACFKCLKEAGVLDSM